MVAGSFDHAAQLVFGQRTHWNINTPTLEKFDEDGEGQTGDFGELWVRIANEIRAASALVLYAEAADFPLKGALTEAGIALGMNKPVIVCLPDLGVLPRNYRPIGSWIAHPLVTRCDDIRAAIQIATNTRLRADSAAPVVDDYVAWCRYDFTNEETTGTTISVCDSDAKGAFKVYRAMPAAASPAAPKVGLHWPFAAKHPNCTECNREYEPPPTKPSGEAVQNTTQEIVDYVSDGILGMGNEVTETDAAKFLEIITRHFAAAPVSESWLPIETAPKDKTVVLVALIKDGKVWRVSEASFNGLGWYDQGGKACHWRTHWIPMPPLPIEPSQSKEEGEG